MRHRQRSWDIILCPELSRQLATVVYVNGQLGLVLYNYESDHGMRLPDLPRVLLKNPRQRPVQSRLTVYSHEKLDSTLRQLLARDSGTALDRRRGSLQARTAEARERGWRGL